MGMSRCYSLMKCLLILFNIIFLAVGVMAGGLAGWALWDGRAAADAGAAGRAGLCALLGWALALAGGALCAVAGAARRSPALLAAAFALLALTCVAEGAAAWWGLAHTAQLRAALRDRLAHTLAHDYGAMPARTQVLDAIQHGLECCGVDSPRDWQSSAWARAQEQAEAGAAGGEALDLTVGAPAAYYWVPASCCVSEAEEGCSSARRVRVGAGGGAGAGAEGLHGAGCGARVVGALAAAARAPLLAGAGLLAAHAAALLLALALCLRAHPPAHYKAPLRYHSSSKQDNGIQARLQHSSSSACYHSLFKADCRHAGLSPPRPKPLVFIETVEATRQIELY